MAPKTSQSTGIPATPAPFASATAVLGKKQRQVLDTLSNDHQLWSVTELATELNSHANTIRDHLNALQAHGLIGSMQRKSAQRGRPTTLYYALTPDDRSLNAEYITLIHTLADYAAKTGENSALLAQKLGSQWAQLLRESGTTPTPQANAEEIATFMAQLGFQPQHTSRGEITLNTCPLRQEQQAPAQFLCAIHAQLLAEFFPPQPNTQKPQLELVSYHRGGTCRLHFNTTK